MCSWIPTLTKEDVLESERAKVGFGGNESEQPSLLSPTASRAPGPARRRQEAWPSFTYVPPPAVIDMRDWRFETYGLVHRPLSLTYAELKELPSITSWEDHTCIDQIVTPGHRFEGIDFRTIVELTRPDPDCEWILYECDGGFTVSHSIHRKMMLAYLRNGEPIGPSHGYPLRVWIPAEWGFKNPKWVRRVKFCEQREPDFYLTYLRQHGMDPSVIAAAYDTNVGSGVPLDAIEQFLRFFYKSWMWDVRHNALGARGKGLAAGHRAPTYIGDDTWTPENYEASV
jgi:DMSO/TMAO reductase YedYZ molybdopterin-dependent catalytic subunit